MIHFDGNWPVHNQEIRQLGLKKDVLPKMALKFLNDIEKQLPKYVQEFNERFPDVKTAVILEKEIQKRVAFFQKVFAM